MLSVAWDAYRAATGHDIPDGAVEVDYPDPGPFWDFEDDDEVQRRLPQLAALYQ